MKKAVVVTCYESNEERVLFVVEALKNKGYKVDAITTNFSHFRKEVRDNVPEGFISINTQKYGRNLSPFRLMSHKQFAIDAFFAIGDIKPDLIWVVAPCNSLIKEARKYKRKNKDVKIIIDIIDMWPESLPISSKLKNTLPFALWKDLRSSNLKYADEVVSECNFYQNILKTEYDGTITTIHWARDAKAIRYDLDLDEEKLVLCYIGSINNIIDIDLIKKLISKIDKKVVLHIIGSGEQTDYMLNTLEKVCEVIYHNNVYDVNEKAMIFNKCHAGINIYKEGLYIGLTVKSIDYFNFGLPIINNIKGDTWTFIEENKVGINVNSDSIIKSKELMNMRNNNQNIIDLFNKNFTKEVFIEKCSKVIDRVNSK